MYGPVDGATLQLTSIAMGSAGGLALFLYGMQKLSDGLKAAAGDGMKSLLARLTTNRFMGAVTGAFVTAVLQSSSITTVLVVGFVSAGLMTLSQTVGVIMGANVGTTITAQILAFNITDYAWLMIAAGFAFWLFSNRDIMRSIGELLMGLGMLFIGMGQMGEATTPLRSYEPFIALMQRMDNRFLAVVVGAVFTALVQSSSATIGIVIMLATQGYISLEAGISLGIGAKIGTCVTAVLAGLSKPAEARQVGLVHVLFNTIGALIWLPFIHQLAEMAIAVSPSFEDLEGTLRLSAETPRQVANAITIFAVLNLIVMIWFTGPIARLAAWLVPPRDEVGRQWVKAKYLDPVFLQTPAIAVDQINHELVHLGEAVARMLEVAPRAFVEGTTVSVDQVIRMDDDVDDLHTEILNYIAILAREELQSNESRQLEDQIEIANNLEAIGDLIESYFSGQGRPQTDAAVRLSDSSREKVIRLYDAVIRSMTTVLRALETNDATLARGVVGRKEEIKGLADAAAEGIASELLMAGTASVTSYRIASDTIHQIRRVFFHLRRIAIILSHTNAQV